MLFDDSRKQYIGSSTEFQNSDVPEKTVRIILRGVGRRADGTPNILISDPLDENKFNSAMTVNFKAVTK